MKILVNFFLMILPIQFILRGFPNRFESMHIFVQKKSFLSVALTTATFFSNVLSAAAPVPDAAPASAVASTALDSLSQKTEGTAGNFEADGDASFDTQFARYKHDIATLTQKTWQLGKIYSKGTLNFQEPFVIRGRIYLGIKPLDGIAFVFHNDPTGSNFANTAKDGEIVGGSNLIGIKYDTWNNDSQPIGKEPSNSFIAAFSGHERNGKLLPGGDFLNVDGLTNGEWHDVAFVWDPKTQKLLHYLKIGPNKDLTDADLMSANNLKQTIDLGSDFVNKYFGGSANIYFAAVAATCATDYNTQAFKLTYIKTKNPITVPFLHVPEKPFNPALSDVKGVTKYDATITIGSRNIDVDSNGFFLIPKDLDHGVYDVVAIDSDGNKTIRNIDIRKKVKLMAPETPFNPSLTPAQGSADPGTVLSICDASGKEIASLTVGDNGLYTIPATITTGVYTVNATDLIGNTTSKLINVNTTVPSLTLPVAKTINPKDFKLSGLTTPGIMVTIDGNPAEIGADGSFVLPPNLADGEHVIVAKDSIGNTATSKIVVDTTPPSMIFSQFPLTNPINPAILNVKGHTEKDNRIFIDDKEIQNSGLVHFSVPKDTKEGLHKVTATGPTGNTKTLSLNVVLTPPSLNLPTNAINPKIGTITAKTDKGALVKVNGISVKVADDGTFEIPTSLKDGTYPVTSTDIAGNVATGSIAINTIPPVLTVPQNAFNPSKVVMKGKVDSSTTKVKVNGTDVVVDSKDNSFAIPAELTTGVYKVEATDVAGNVSSASVTIDTDIPSLVLFEHPVNPSKNVRGWTVAGASVNINGKDVGVADKDGLFDIPMLPDGEYPVIVTDIAGNSASGTIIIHTTPPSLTCSDVINYNDSNTLKGTTDPHSVVSVHGQMLVDGTTKEQKVEVPVRKDGAFMIVQGFQPGHGKIVVRDRAGNVTKKDVTFLDVTASSSVATPSSNTATPSAAPSAPQQVAAAVLPSATPAAVVTTSAAPAAS